MSNLRKRLDVLRNDPEIGKDIQELQNWKPDALTRVVTALLRADQERIAKLVESGKIDVVYRYTPYPHNPEFTKNPLAELAEHIRQLPDE